MKVINTAVMVNHKAERLHIEDRTKLESFIQYLFGHQPCNDCLNPLATNDMWWGWGCGWGGGDGWGGWLVTEHYFSYLC